MSGPVSSVAATAAATSTSPTSALSSLSGNFNDFLNLLMTQLQNQDPTTPLDTNQFTSQLVQFASVAQQINTNSSLTQLIQLSQGSELLQTTGIVGGTVAAQSSTLPLQNGQAALQFQSPTAQTATIRISSAAGAVLYSADVAASAGANNWSWNGQAANGTVLPDGAYNVAVTAGSAKTALSFNVIGTATGVVTDGTTPQVQIGATTVPLSAVRSVNK